MAAMMCVVVVSASLAPAAPLRLRGVEVIEGDPAHSQPRRKWRERVRAAVSASEISLDGTVRASQHPSIENESKPICPP